MGEDVRGLSLWATQGLLPDVTILLDADPCVGAARTSGRGQVDRLERELDGARAALRTRFLGMAQSEPERWRVVDAARSVEDVAAQVRQVLCAALEGRVGNESCERLRAYLSQEGARSGAQGGEQA